MLHFIRGRLSFKLFLSYLVVVIVGMLVLGITTQLAIPAAFQRHMTQVSGAMSGMMGGRMGQSMFASFQAGVLEALAWASAAAILAAVVVSWFVSRQVVTPIQRMMVASQRIAEGHYEERVQAPEGEHKPSDSGVPQLGDELEQLADSFNQMAARLDETEQMRRQLIGDVSHELRTPLTVIKGTMEGLIDGVLPAEPETFQQVHQEVDRLQRLVADLEELSRVESGAVPLNIQPIPVDRLVNTVLDRMGRLFEAKGVQLLPQLNADLPVIMGDEDRLIQVLVNLVGNALKYTPSGGRVALEATPEGKAVVFAVRDSGIGITAEHLPHVFTRFYRVDKSRARASGGSGIGLTIARSIVEAHGGRIWAESEGQGKGSTFFFTLPVS